MQRESAGRWRTPRQARGGAWSAAHRHGGVTTPAAPSNFFFTIRRCQLFGLPALRVLYKGDAFYYERHALF